MYVTCRNTELSQESQLPDPVKEEEGKRRDDEEREAVDTHWCVLCREDGSMEVGI